MAVIQITIPDATNERLIQAICNNYGYATNGAGMTPGDFAISQLVAWGVNQIAASDMAAANLAGSQAQAAALAATPPVDPSTVSVAVT